MKNKTIAAIAVLLLLAIVFSLCLSGCENVTLEGVSGSETESSGDPSELPDDSLPIQGNHDYMNTNWTVGISADDHGRRQTRRRRCGAGSAVQRARRAVRRQNHDGSDRREEGRLRSERGDPRGDAV